MMKRLFLAIPLLFILVSACSTTATPSEMVFPTPSFTRETLPTEVSPPTSLTQKCQAMILDYPRNNAFSGTLVLASASTRGNQFLNMDSGAIRPILENEESLAFDFKVSPDGNWLAYNSEDRLAVNSLIVQSADGKKSFASRQDGFIAYWLNNSELILWHPSGNGFLDYVTVFNPFTMSKRVLGNDYPNIIPEDIGWDHWPSLTIFDPSLQYVLYVAISGSNYQPGDHKLILWNRRSNQEVAQISSFGYTSVRPIWKSDGSDVLFVKALTGIDPPVRQDEWFVLSIKGEARQITKLSEMFQSPSIYSASLSPDERFIAFELETNFSRKTGESTDRRVLILDLTTLELTDYCLVPEAFTSLIWSRDSQYLAFSQTTSDKDVRTVILDILHGSAFVAAKHLQPEGWLNPGN